MASTSKGKARKHQKEPHTFLSNLDILQSRANYRIHIIKSTERGNPLKRDFLAYIEPATDKSPEKKLPVCLYQGVWHSLKYTNTGDDKLGMYLAWLGPKALALAWLDTALALQKYGPGQRPPCWLGSSLAWLKPGLLTANMILYDTSDGPYSYHDCHCCCSLPECVRTRGAWS